MELSFPLQLTLVSQIGPSPLPNVIALGTDVADVKFNIRHTTSASLMSHPLLQTRPHIPFRLTSTRPWFGEPPSARRIPETVDIEQHRIVRRSLISIKLFTIYKHLFITRWHILAKVWFLNFARPPLIQPESERDWVEAGNDVTQATQTQINMPNFSKKCDLWKSNAELIRCRHLVRDCEKKLYVARWIEFIKWRHWEKPLTYFRGLVIFNDRWLLAL